MSLENLQVPNNYQLYVNGVINGVGTSNYLQTNSGTIGCVINAASVTIQLVQVSAAPTSMVDIEIQWALGSVNTTSASFLQLTTVLPAQFIPQKEKTIYGQVTQNLVNIPVYLDIDTAGNMYIKNSANSAGTFTNAVPFNFLTINGCYSLSG